MGRRRFMLRAQLTQVDSPATARFLHSLAQSYGGAVGWQATSSGRGKLNWQRTGDGAAAFLSDVVPHLVLKRAQAEIAVAWQKGRPKQQRDERGRIMAFTDDDLRFNEAVAHLLKRLKREDIDQVMADQQDLVTIEHTLRQVLNYKGT